MKKNIIYVDFIFRKKRIRNKFYLLIYKINILFKKYIKKKNFSKIENQEQKNSFFKKVL